MTTIKELYTAVSNKLAEVGLISYPYIPGSSEWPGAFIMPPMVEHEGLSDDWTTCRFEVLVFVSSSIDEHQLRLLDYQDFDGERSISAAFRADPSLGGNGADVRVARSRPLGLDEQAGYQGFGSAFEFVARLS